MARRPAADQFLPLPHVSYQILLAMADEPLHGYAIIKEVARRTAGQTVLETGTLYAALKRLRDDSMIETARPPTKGGDARRKYYRLAPLGRKVLQLDSERMVGLLAAAREKSVIR